jgi:hypothetical protein
VLDQQHTLPEQVDIAALAVTLFDWRLKRSDPAAGDPEDIEKTIPEALGLGIFRAFICPFPGESQGAVAYFIPGKRHGESFTATRGKDKQPLKKWPQNSRETTARQVDWVNRPLHLFLLT